MRNEMGWNALPRPSNWHPETPFPGTFPERNQKMRFPDSFIFNGLEPLKKAAHPCAALVPTVYPDTT
jgi:hypothetical protein